MFCERARLLGPKLGVLLFHMLTGRLLFRANNPAQLVYKIINADPPSVSQLNPDVPQQMDAVIRKALEKDLYSRYKNGAEFAKDLSAAITVETSNVSCRWKGTVTLTNKQSVVARDTDGRTTTVSDLADALGRSPSATSRLVDGLVVEAELLAQRQAMVRAACDDGRHLDPGLAAAGAKEDAQPVAQVVECHRRLGKAPIAGRARSPAVPVTADELLDLEKLQHDRSPDQLKVDSRQPFRPGLNRRQACEEALSILPCTLPTPSLA